MINSSKLKILLVDDDLDIQEFISYNLKKEGYMVFLATNGEDAIITAQKEKPDLIILDVMMPKIDGIEACRKIRSLKGLNNVIIAFLSARAEDYAQIAGYDAGADDYITKPIKPDVFIKKVKSLLRRAKTKQQDSASSIITSIKINSENHSIIIDNNRIILPKKEFKLLCLLASNPDKVFTREEIYKTVWGDEVIVGDRTIDVHIRKIREKIGNEFISTFKGIGYKFENI